MSTMQSRTKHKFVFTITLHRVEGIRGLYDDDAVCIAWKRGTSSGRSKEAMMCNDLITWDETFEVAVSLHMVENTGNLSENSGKFEKKMLKFNLRQAASDERIADVEIDLSRYVGVACQVMIWRVSVLSNCTLNSVASRLCLLTPYSRHLVLSHCTLSPSPAFSRLCSSTPLCPLRVRVRRGSS